MKTCFFNVQVCLAAFIILSCSGAETGIRGAFRGEDIIPRSANRIFIMPLNVLPGKDFPAAEMYSRLRAALNSRGRLAVVESMDQCDLFLRCSIISLSEQNIKFTPSGTPSAVRIRITLSVDLEKCRPREPVLKNRIVEASRIFSETLPPVESRSRAMLNLIDTVNERITSLIETGWYTDRMTPAERGK